MRIKLFIPLLAISAAFSVHAQETEVHGKVSRALAGMNSDRWDQREAAFNSLPALDKVSKEDPTDSESVKTGIINLLGTENAEVKKGTRLSEEYTNYYGEVIGAVSDLNDERAIPALVGAITTGSMATRALARFGDKSLDRVLTQLDSPDRLVRASVIETVRNILEMHIALTPASQARIRDAIRSSLNDREFVVRGSAIDATEYLDNREEFIPELEKISQSDPVKLPGKSDDGGDGGQFYPLREQARKLLRKITNHEPPRNATVG